MTGLSRGQLAPGAGTEVIALTSSAGKAQEVIALAASHGFALQQVPDPVAGRAVRHRRAGRRTWFMTPAAEDTFEMSLDMLATRGTLVLYGQSQRPGRPLRPRPASRR